MSMTDILKIEMVIFVSLPRFSHLKTRYFTLAELETARWAWVYSGVKTKTLVEISFHEKYEKNIFHIHFKAWHKRRGQRMVIPSIACGP